MTDFLYILSGPHYMTSSHEKLPKNEITLIRITHNLYDVS